MKAYLNKLNIKLEKIHRKGCTLRITHRNKDYSVWLGKMDRLEINRQVEAKELLFALFCLLIINPFKRLSLRGFDLRSFYGK